jgi:dipeptidyl aminopeptidase/acylaminoacyl peptidase
MKRALLTIVPAAFLAAATLAAQEKRPMSAADVMAMRQVGNVEIAPNGQDILYTVAAWEHPAAKGDTALGDRHERRSHIWVVPADPARGPARQLTFGERGETSPGWSPDGQLVTFIATRGTGDDAKAQLWMLRRDGGEASAITKSKESVNAYAWSPDGKRLAYLTVDTASRDDDAKIRRRDDAKVFEENFRLTHLWVIDADGKNPVEVVHDNLTIRGAPSWSPDGTRLTFTASPTPMIRDERRDAYIVTIATKQIEKITTTADVRSLSAWSPDGRTIAYTMLPAEHKPLADGIMSRTLGNDRLMLFDVESKKARDVSSASFDVSAGEPRWSADGKHVWFLAGDRAVNSAFDYDVAANKYTKVSKDQLIQDISMSKDGARAALLIDSPAWPTEVYVQDAAHPTPARLTNTNPQVANLALGETEVITWKSDGGTVEGILLKPVGYQPGKRYPLLVNVHGGPTGAHTNGFKASVGGGGQYWAGRGWAVLYPNPRGSTNYGAQFMRANIKDWGGGDYRDVMTGVDEVVRRGVADSSRLALSGWSYGGYMTAWAVTQTGRFKAAMEGAGLTDLQSMYGTTDIPGYIGTFFEGMPTQKTLDFYRARSAITFVDRVTTPLLILHGGNDERVPIGQPMEYFRALKERGKTVQLVFYPREGHGLTEYYHQLDRLNREYDWIVRYTLKQPETKVLQ